MKAPRVRALEDLRRGGPGVIARGGPDTTQRGEIVHWTWMMGVIRGLGRGWSQPSRRRRTAERRE